jgi:hypothetical protein
MKIPYGQSHFATLRRRGMFYADKTPFLPLLESEDAGFRHLLFLRPRRFGKSTLVSMLEHYYDLAEAPHFDELFRGLWIHEHPTPERNRYLVLVLDFSPVSTEGDAAAIQQSFATCVRARVRGFLMRYRDRFPELGRLEADLESHRDAAGLMTTLLSIVRALGHQLYLLIDEYDHFANRLLADGGEDVYESIVRGTGFVRSFYAALKAETSSGALGRMFVTGVSPIMLDDLSSGFNIIRHISMWERFNAMAGFTRAETERAVDEMLQSRPELRNDPQLGDRDGLMATLVSYYNGYRFFQGAPERVFNSDLILYFLSEIQNTGRYPSQMLDVNVKTDYGRLQRIASLSGAVGTQTRDLLETILTEESITSQLVERFGARTMQRPEQLVSLFYYMGMLTFAEQASDARVPRLTIPNRVIRTLQWEYLAIALQEQQGLSFDTRRMDIAVDAMAVAGDIQPLIDLFRDEVVARIGVKDQRQINEGTLKLMLLAYLSNSRIYHILSEKEFARGYCDLFLALTEIAGNLRYAWMLEVKYLKTSAKQADIERAFAEAAAQLERYSSDEALLQALTRGKEHKAGTIVFVGARDVLYRPWPPPPPPAGKAPSKGPKTEKVTSGKASSKTPTSKKPATRKAAPKKATPKRPVAREAPRRKLRG